MALLTPIEVRRHFFDGPVAVDSAIRFADKIVMRRPPQFIEDVAGQDFASILPRGAHPIELEEPYCLKLENVRVIGFRHIVTTDNHLLSDYFMRRQNFLSRIQHHHAPTYQDTDFVVEGNMVRSERIEDVDAEIDEPAILLSSSEPMNYGSFLFRILPKLITARDYYVDDLKYFVHISKNPPFQRNLLQLAGVEADKLTHHDTKRVYWFKELYVPGMRNAQAYLDRQTVQFYRRFVTSLGITQKPKRLVYVSRRIAAANRPQTRVFVNEAELIAELEKLGFDILEPETLSSLDQIKRFAKAKLVVGPSGAGMFNAVFASARTMVISIEAFPFWLQTHANLFDSLGQKYALIVGQPDVEDPAPIHKRWSLDVPRAVERIKRVAESLA